MMTLKIFFTGFFLLGGAILLASEDFPEQSGSSDSVERWYRIELLIYKQKPVPGAIDEVWPHDISLSYPATWVRLKSQEEYIANPYPHPVLASWLSRIKKSPYTPFVLQSDSMKSFSKTAKQIERFENGVLFHSVWWQPFIQNDLEQNPAILIKAGRNYGDHAELEGSITFKLSRYLHIYTNLWLSEFATPTLGSTGESVPSFNPWPLLPLPPDKSFSSSPDGDSTLIADAYLPSQIIQIKQSRRMRSEETHYIDHPKLGIVVRVTPQAEKR